MTFVIDLALITFLARKITLILFLTVELLRILSDSIVDNTINAINQAISLIIAMSIAKVLNLITGHEIFRKCHSSHRTMILDFNFAR